MPTFKEDPWDPKVIAKWLVQIGLTISFIYLGYRSYLIYHEPPGDAEKKGAFENAQIYLYLSVNAFVLFVVVVSRVLEYCRDRKDRN